MQINFVHANNAVKIKKFLNNTPRNIPFINYIDIVNKLTKNDYLYEEPTDSVVSSYLIKSLTAMIDDESISCFYYVLSSLNEDVINNIKSIVNQSYTDVKYVLYIDKEILNLPDTDFHEINKF